MVIKTQLIGSVLLIIVASLIACTLAHPLQPDASSGNPRMIEVPLLRKNKPGRVDQMVMHKTYDGPKSGRRGLKEFKYEKKLENFYNYQFVGSLYVGTHFQEMSFLFDTGSAWVWIPNKDCPDTECPGNHYNYDKSTNYHDTKKYESIEYGQGFVNGTVSNDDFALTSSKKTQARYVNFLSVFESKDFMNLESDGILGLSPKTKEKGYDSGIMKHLFVNELKKDRVIDKAMFSVFLGSIDTRDYTETVSKIQFGGWQQSIVDNSYRLPKKQDQGIKWLDINSEYHWQVSLIEVRIDDKTIQKKGKNAFFDSGASYSFIPKPEFEAFLQEIKAAGKECELMSWGVHYCKCQYIDDAGWPVLKIEIGSQRKREWIYQKGEDYLMYSPNYEQCMIRMRGDLGDSFEDAWLLGVPFMQAYYTIHDMDMKRIGLVRVNKEPNPADEQYRAMQERQAAHGNANKEKEKQTAESGPTIVKEDEPKNQDEDRVQGIPIPGPGGSSSGDTGSAGQTTPQSGTVTGGDSKGPGSGAAGSTGGPKDSSGNSGGSQAGETNNDDKKPSAGGDGSGSTNQGAGGSNTGSDGASGGSGDQKTSDTTTGGVRSCSPWCSFQDQTETDALVDWRKKQAQEDQATAQMKEEEEANASTTTDTSTSKEGGSSSKECEGAGCNDGSGEGQASNQVGQVDQSAESSEAEAQSYFSGKKSTVIYENYNSLYSNGPQQEGEGETKSLMDNLKDIPIPLLVIVIISFIMCTGMVAFKHYRIKSMQHQIKALAAQVEQEQQLMESKIQELQGELEQPPPQAANGNEARSDPAAGAQQGPRPSNAGTNSTRRQLLGGQQPNSNAAFPLHDASSLSNNNASDLRLRERAVPGPAPAPNQDAEALQ